MLVVKARNTEQAGTSSFGEQVADIPITKITKINGTIEEETAQEAVDV